MLTECCAPIGDQEKLARDLGLASWRSIVAMMRAIQRVGLDFSLQDASQLMAKYSEPAEGEDVRTWSKSV